VGLEEEGKFREEVDTRDELLAAILVAASHIKKRERSTETNCFLLQEKPVASPVAVCF